MKRIVLLFLIASSLVCKAEDGSRLWLRADTKEDAKVTSDRRSAVTDVAIQELKSQWKGAPVKLSPYSRDKALPPGKEGFLITGNKQTGITIRSSSEQGILYGAYHLLRLQETGNDDGELRVSESPAYSIRILNHWDNPDGTIERGYAGHSLWKWDELPGTLSPRYRQYARANASIGINGTVLNNVNASPAILKEDYLRKVKALADIFRPYGIKVYLSVNFSSPKITGGLQDSDPLNPDVRKWWGDKVKEIYKLIPDFGGFLVKANSEGQPGPQDYGRTHADGANMLAGALKPYGGIVMWRAFVYSPGSDDRAKQAFNEFMPLDGEFMDNVIVQVKNGPVDFQPREPFTPLFGAMRKTPLMAEFQITQEYLGHANHLAFLAPLFKEVLESDTFSDGEGSTVAGLTDGTLRRQKFTAIAGVANIGEDANWCGHHFSQANWYAFGRLAWNHKLSASQIADEWIRMTFSGDEQFVQPVREMMLSSREAVVNYMMPLGLHHIFAEGHHYGPQPWYDKAPREDWTCTYYHKADERGVGFDRTDTGSNAVTQYAAPLQEMYGNMETCPENLLLWFHHAPWEHRMKSGRTLWEELCRKYDAGVRQAREFQMTWDRMEPYTDHRRFAEVQSKLKIQTKDAVWWKDACLLYFQTFSKRPVPYDLERPVHELEDLKRIKLNLKHHN